MARFNLEETFGVQYFISFTSLKNQVELTYRRIPKQLKVKKLDFSSCPE